jgi:hypothetical protein
LPLNQPVINQRINVFLVRLMRRPIGRLFACIHEQVSWKLSLSSNSIRDNEAHGVIQYLGLDGVRIGEFVKLGNVAHSA